MLTAPESANLVDGAEENDPSADQGRKAFGSQAGTRRVIADDDIFQFMSKALGVSRHGSERTLATRRSARTGTSWAG